MKITQPEINSVYSYIIQTHKSDHITITIDHIRYALGQKVIQKGEPVLEDMEKACCIGHFKCINYAIKLAGYNDFPAKKIDNEYHIEKALEWLKEVHSLMMYPIADWAFKTGNKDMYIQKYQCGTYRYTPQALAFTMAPEPYMIPKILQKWLIDMYTLDSQVKDKIDNPYGITMQQSKTMQSKVKEIPMFFSCLSPFQDGNNRVGKLVENIFRLRWRMTWRTISELELDKYNKELSIYQEKEFKKWL